jgi:hypothetical protein
MSERAKARVGCLLVENAGMCLVRLSGWRRETRVSIESMEDGAL